LAIFTTPHSRKEHARGRLYLGVTKKLEVRGPPHSVSPTLPFNFQFKLSWQVKNMETKLRVQGIPTGEKVGLSLPVDAIILSAESPLYSKDSICQTCSVNGVSRLKVATGDGKSVCPSSSHRAG
jgi:hypothetical protein